MQNIYYYQMFMFYYECSYWDMSLFNDFFLLKTIVQGGNDHFKKTQNAKEI